MINYKKHKHIEDVMEEYLDKQEELQTIPSLLKKNGEKHQKFSEQQKQGESLSADEAQDLFKLFIQKEKLLDTQDELTEELKELEEVLKSFLGFVNQKIQLTRKEEGDKNRVNYIFFLDNDELRIER